MGPGRVDYGFAQMIESDPFGFFCPGLRTLNTDTQWTTSGSEGGDDLLISGMLEMKGLADLAEAKRRHKFHDPTLEENDNPTFDMIGANREWISTSLTTFTPTGCDEATRAKVSSVGVGGPSTVQISSSINTFPLQSSGLSTVFNQFQRNGGGQYQDHQFPPTHKSLAGRGDKHVSPVYQTYKWKRPYEIFQGNYDVCSRASVNPNDLKQGSLGDCYFIAAISAVAENPFRVAKLILSKDYNPFGVHAVTLFITGVWEEVIMDDLFPYDASAQQPAFSTSRTKDIWVMLLEKAFAKVNGGYKDIEAGFISEALLALTGAPVYTYFVQSGNPEENWRIMLEGERNNYIMCCASGDFNKTGNDAADNRSGLSGNHAYSLLSAHEINHQGRMLRLVKLRNPWGKGEWKGDWSDRSPLWTPELRRQLNVTDTDDGIFFMSFEDWQRYFHDFDVCYYHDNYVHSNKLFCSSPNTPTVLRFTITRPGEYYFMLSQTNSRQFSKADRYTYSNLSIIVAKVQGGSISHVGTSSKDDQLNWFKAACQPGEYVAFIETPWKRNVNRFGFSIYGPEQVNFEPADPSSFPGGFVENILMDKARKEPQQLKAYSAQGEPDIKYRFETSLESFSYFYFSNKSQNTTLKATVQMIDSVGIELLPPYTGQRNPEVVVNPGEEKIIVCKMTGGTCRLSSRVSAQFIKGAGGPTSRVIRDIGGDHGYGGFGGANAYQGGAPYSPTPSPGYGGGYGSYGAGGNFSSPSPYGGSYGLNTGYGGPSSNLRSAGFGGSPAYQGTRPSGYGGTPGFGGSGSFDFGGY
jgi:hypothetical protein